MADTLLFIGWGEPARGREEWGLEVFNEVVGMYGRMQQEGRIESFDVGILSPTGGDLDGYILVKGSAEQIAAVQTDPDYERTLAEATLCVQGLRIIPGACNEGIAHQMDVYREAVSTVPQTA